MGRPLSNPSSPDRSGTALFAFDSSLWRPAPTGVPIIRRAHHVRRAWFTGAWWLREMLIPFLRDGETDRAWVKSSRAPALAPAPTFDDQPLGPTRSLIAGTLAVSHVKPRQPSCHPSWIVRSSE